MTKLFSPGEFLAGANKDIPISPFDPTPEVTDIEIPNSDIDPLVVIQAVEPSNILTSYFYECSAAPMSDIKDYEDLKNWLPYSGPAVATLLGSETDYNNGLFTWGDFKRVQVRFGDFYNGKITPFPPAYSLSCAIFTPLS